MKNKLSILALSMAAVLPSHGATTLLTENFDTATANTQPNQTPTSVTDFPSFTAVQLTGGGDGIGSSTNAALPQLAGSTRWAYFNTSNGNYMAAYTSAFTITAATTDLTLKVDLGRRTNFGDGRYILGFVENYDGAVTGASASGTAVGSFTLGGTGGGLLGAVQIQKSAITSGEFLLNQTATYTSTVGSQVRAVLIFDNTGTNFQQGNFDNFSLTAVPEPSIMGLLGLTTIGIATLRRRRA